MSRENRAPDQLREIHIVSPYNKHAEGSALIECGDTRVICTASVEEKIPHFLRGAGQGWVTAEYAMLPRSTGSRMTREVSRGRPSGRTQEIQRLIGRSMRSVIDLKQLGERSIWIDCDVIQADGGTRTTSITGAFVALALAVDHLLGNGTLKASPLRELVAAVSVGIVAGEPRLDLSYQEDSIAQVDMNVVMTNSEGFVEVQGTAEGHPFHRQELDGLIDLASTGIRKLIDLQARVLEQQCQNFGRVLPVVSSP